MYSTLLVPVDDSAIARSGLDEAIALAAKLGSRLHVLNVVDVRMLLAEVSAEYPPQRRLDEWRTAGRELVDQAVARARARGVVADGTVRCDPGLRVCDAIIEEAREAEVGLIVMGTHGRRGLGRLALGSDAEQVVRESPVPVLLVRQRQVAAAG